MRDRAPSGEAGAEGLPATQILFLLLCLRCTGLPGNMTCVIAPSALAGSTAYRLTSSSDHQPLPMGLHQAVDMTVSWKNECFPDCI